MKLPVFGFALYGMVAISGGCYMSNFPVSTRRQLDDIMSGLGMNAINYGAQVWSGWTLLERRVTWNWRRNMRCNWAFNKFAKIQTFKWSCFINCQEINFFEETDGLFSHGVQCTRCFIPVVVFYVGDLISPTHPLRMHTHTPRFSSRQFQEQNRTNVLFYKLRT